MYLVFELHYNHYYGNLCPLTAMICDEIILYKIIFLILVQLLSEEYGLMSPKTMETKGLINASEYQKIYALTQSVSSDVHKKISGT